MTAAPVLEIENLSIGYRTMEGMLHAVRDVSLIVKRAEILGLVGESGCGKSTLAYAMLGDLGEGGVRENGRVLFEGQDLLSLQESELQRLRGARIAMVHQNPGAALSPSVKIGPQLMEILAVHGESSGRMARKRTLDLLDRVHLPDSARLMERYPHELSGGQQQRAVIAAALLGEPDLLVLDEPTTGLDVTVEATVLDLLVEIRDAMGVGIVYIAHNLGVIARICERVGVMYAGELVELADIKALFHEPRHPYTRSLLRCVPRVDRPMRRHGLAPIPGTLPNPYRWPGGCAFASRCDLVQDRCHRTHPELAPIPGDRRVRCLRWNDLADAAPGEAPRTRIKSSDVQRPQSEVLAVRGLSIDYRLPRRRLTGPRPVLRAVEDVSFCTHKGQVTAIVGESGCGKSSLAAGIVGLRVISAGELRFAGHEIARPVGKRPSIIHRLLQMVFQDHGATLNPSVSIGRIIGRPLQLFGIVARREIGMETRRLLEAVGLDAPTAGRRPEQLSGGQRQRVAIARAFAGRPQLVVCDEITSALDVSVQASVLNFLLELQRREGTSLIFISHDIGVVRYLADEVAVMYLGRICELGPAEAVFSGPNHPYTEALLSAVPVPDPSAPRPPIRLEGPVPSALARPSGCAFHTRCPRKIGRICEEQRPPVRDVGGGHRIECHLALEDLGCRSASTKTAGSVRAMTNASA